MAGHDPGIDTTGVVATAKPYLAEPMPVVEPLRHLVIGPDLQTHRRFAPPRRFVEQRNEQPCAEPLTSRLRGDPNRLHEGLIRIGTQARVALELGAVKSDQKVPGLDLSQLGPKVVSRPGLSAEKPAF